jgi:hypothetical protein
MPEPEAQNAGEAVEQISNLLQGKPVETPEPSPEPGETPGEEEPPQAMTPAILAERLGLKPAELFEQFQIPVDGGDSMTLSEFKDAGVEFRGLKAAQDELAEAKVTFENNVMMQRQTLKKAMERLSPDVLTPELIAHVQEEQQQYITTERQALHNVRPDLRDPAKWDATRELLVAHLQPYGFSPIEVDSISDHRLAKYAIDNAEREQRVRQLNADGIEVETPPKLQAPSAEPARASRRAKEKPAATKPGKPRTLQDKAGEVAALLGAK